MRAHTRRGEHLKRVKKETPDWRRRRRERRDLNENFTGSQFLSFPVILQFVSTKHFSQIPNRCLRSCISLLSDVC